jgi:ArsR family transcriptional regulator
MRDRGYKAHMLNPDAFFAALADPTRRRILALLQEGDERCVCVLYETLDLPQPKVSRHLGVLRAAGVVATRREGLWIHYRIHPDLPDWARSVLAALGEAVGGPDEPISSCGACAPPADTRRFHHRRGHRNA